MNIDYDWLRQNYNVMLQAPDRSKYNVKATALIEPETARDFLEAYRQHIQGKDHQVAATYFAAYWRGVCAAMQIMVATTSEMLDFSLGNFTLHLAEANGYNQLMFVLEDAAGHPWPPGTHETVRELMFTRFYGETLRPMFEVIAAEAGVTLGQLWYQMPLGIEYYLKHGADMLEDESARSRIEEGYRYTVEGLAPSVFGLKQNPFAFKRVYIDDPYHPGEKTVMKPTCCLAYRTDAGYGYCQSCPKLTKEQRAKMNAEISQSLNA
ncbi:hypothetical protein DCC85_20530 [Paenibacillus sp. CAA11]|uniref:(2Fe-2S)-binding protein n=1 Tax=Paenibacillus sp. CAA11 TaxID=1532905 RepID=UPI000D3D791C|nr:(2Fe-2S)-binding protein [Paenibacillus sp. CAA11]AWB46315.1 hypothetical protein DCC85_20530 [Paenibacillus sp. CAA11]